MIRRETERERNIYWGKCIHIWTDRKNKGTPSHTETQICAKGERTADLLSTHMSGWLENSKGFSSDVNRAMLYFGQKQSLRYNDNKYGSKLKVKQLYSCAGLSLGHPHSFIFVQLYTWKKKKTN